MANTSKLVARSSERLVKSDDQARPSNATAEEAFRSIIRWVGEDPTRDGLQATPRPG